jgi:membrane protein implicated in regulation of membrane protease activity
VHFHLPHLHVGDLHISGVHGPHAGAGGGELPFFNFATLSAFLAWFGGTGYLLERYYGVWFLFALATAFASGLGGAAAVFWFMAKILFSKEEDLDPADYDMVGVLGKITNPIRVGGTGEIVFSQEGVRRVSGARSEDGTAIPKGTEVVVTRYESGIAYVRRWDELTGPAESDLELHKN